MSLSGTSTHLKPLQAWGLHHCPGQPGILSLHPVEVIGKHKENGLGGDHVGRLS